jgi:hypothetical protein
MLGQTDAVTSGRSAPDSVGFFAIKTDLSPRPFSAGALSEKMD